MEGRGGAGKDASQKRGLRPGARGRIASNPASDAPTSGAPDRHDEELSEKAARRLGLKEVPVQVAKDLTPQQAKAYRIADNRLAEIADRDDELLGLELEELQGEDFDLSLLGFTEREMEKLLAAEEAWAPKGDPDGKEYDESIAEEVEWLECPKCHHKWPK